MNNIKFLSASLITAILIFTGCGGSSDAATNQAPATETGTFVDAPVVGLSYQTATQSGFTDASGKFKYVAGEEVEFKLGNLSLGKGTADKLVTPYSISENNDTAVNIALLLQNFDGNRSDSSILNLSKLKEYNFNLNDFYLSKSPATIKGQIEILFADNSFAEFRDGANNTVLDETAVKTAMDTHIEIISTQYDKKFTQAYLDNKTLYWVFRGDASEAASVITMEFISNTTILWSGVEPDGTTTWSDNVPYSLENGSIIFEPDGAGQGIIDKFTITAVEEDRLTVQHINADDNRLINTDYIFYIKTDADDYLNSL